MRESCNAVQALANSVAARPQLPATEERRLLDVPGSGNRGRHSGRSERYDDHRGSRSGRDSGHRSRYHSSRSERYHERDERSLSPSEEARRRRRELERRRDARRLGGGSSTPPSVEELTDSPR